MVATSGDTGGAVANGFLRVEGVNVVILSASEREREGSQAKTRLERKMEPAFDVCIELLSRNKWRIHPNVAKSVDVVLRGLRETRLECH